MLLIADGLNNARFNAFIGWSIFADRQAGEGQRGSGGIMRFLIAGLALAAMTTGAYAQSAPGGALGPASQIGQHAAKAGEDKAGDGKAKANEKAYNAALKNLPDKQYDPWHGVR
jgi:hypothetical protein